jgi:hypothetical protein
VIRKEPLHASVTPNAITITQRGPAAQLLGQPEPAMRNNNITNIYCMRMIALSKVTALKKALVDLVNVQSRVWTHVQSTRQCTRQRDVSPHHATGTCPPVMEDTWYPISQTHKPTRGMWRHCHFPQTKSTVRDPTPLCCKASCQT